MPESLDEWADKNFDRTFALHTSQAETVKIIVTLTLGVASAFVVTALQVKPPQNWWDGSACIADLVAFLLTMATVLSDSLGMVSTDKVGKKMAEHGWTDEQAVSYARRWQTKIQDENKKVIQRMRHITEYQVLACTVASALSVVSLFLGA